MEKKSLWSFGTREVVYAAVGAALYGVFSWATNWIGLPRGGQYLAASGCGDPPVLCVAFGPIVGFITGFLGNVLGDFLSGYGFWWSWDLGNGLMGLIPGLMAAGIASGTSQGHHHQGRDPGCDCYGYRDAGTIAVGDSR